jgi:hypothetical protein
MLETNRSRRTLLLGSLLSVQVACGVAPTLVKMDPSRPISRDDGYQQEGQTLDPEDMTAKLSEEPEAAPHVSRAKTLNLIAVVLGAAGGALVGWPVGGAIAGDSNPKWGLAYAGGGAILVSIPLILWGVSSFNSAVDAHNSRVGMPPAPNP